MSRWLSHLSSSNRARTIRSAEGGSGWASGRGNRSSGPFGGSAGFPRRPVGSRGGRRRGRRGRVGGRGAGLRVESLAGVSTLVSGAPGPARRASRPRRRGGRPPERVRSVRSAASGARRRRNCPACVVARARRKTFSLGNPDHGGSESGPEAAAQLPVTRSGRSGSPKPRTPGPRGVEARHQRAWKTFRTAEVHIPVFVGACSVVRFLLFLSRALESRAEGPAARRRLSARGPKDGPSSGAAALERTGVARGGEPSAALREVP